MAEVIFHLHVKWLSRSDGRDAVAAAAYRAGERLANDRAGGFSDFTHKAGRVLYSEIILPQGSPDWAEDRAKLWNTVESVEKRKDARLAVEVEFAIPYSVPREEWEPLAQRMAREYADEGHAVDMALHLGEDGKNPHVHMLMSMRRLSEDGFARKRMEGVDKRGFVTAARLRWEKIANFWLHTFARSRDRVDSRSYAERGIRKKPGRHVPPDRIERARKRRERASQNLTERLEWQRRQMDERPEFERQNRDEPKDPWDRNER